ncbi:BTAD domain-containing putative transcriptional regulator, partial [Actinoplanes sp. NPDC024001]|uniref:BTAD domain-containing putative transcriptional regulator n=1 Tax=Actinoplanes sp. NPDC024001 TaxID=3154598 RepID=UPI0033F01CC7
PRSGVLRAPARTGKWAARRQRALLTRLLLDPGRVVPAERLIDDVYGDQPPAGAPNALQAQVSRLRQALRPDDAILASLPAGYRLDVAPDDVDAHRFERLAAAGRQQLATGDPAAAVRLLDEALGLWRGPALSDLEGAVAAAARWEELRLAAVEDRCDANLALGRHAEAVAELSGLVARHPLRERLRGLLIRALHGSGRQAEALAAFEEARRTLADELGADPSPALAAVHLAVLREQAVPQEQKVRTVTGVPAQLTTFVGRDAELRRLAKQLGEARLVTLIGPGGAGKTRLAVEGVRRRTEEVCFIELGPLTESADVGHAVLAAVGLRDSGLLAADGGRRAPDPVDRLALALADRPVLLVLDNCEHLVDAVADFAARLLARCPSVRVLATSREALGVTGETLCPVPPLALPPPEESPAAPLEYAALRLFAERAAAVRPGFTVDAGNVGAVVRICRALDGLPLAIELAAARIRVFDVHEVADRLTDRFRLLSRGSRTAPARHRTLRAVVEWSWELLDADERLLARRLTVFAGGATLDAAQRVCRVDDLEDVLAGLVDKSLVEAGPRLRMLETVRAFGAEQLALAGEEDMVRRAQLAYLTDLAMAAEPGLRRADQVEWLRGLDGEHDNIVDALRWAVRHDPPLALRLAAPMGTYWGMRGWGGGDSVLCLELLDAVGWSPPEGLTEEYAVVLATATRGDLHGSRRTRLLAELEPLVVQSLYAPRFPFLIVMWSIMTGIGGGDRMDRAVIGADLAEPDPWLAALLRLGEGFAGIYGGDADAAEAQLRAAADSFRSIGDRWGMTVALAERAKLLGLRGDGSAARACYDEAITLVEELGTSNDMADLISQRVLTSIHQGDPTGDRLDDALADAERAAVLARRAGSPMILAYSMWVLAEVERLRGESGRAHQWAEQALAVCPTGWFSAEEIRGQVLVTLGRLAEAAGEAEAARAWHLRAAGSAVRWQHRPAVAYGIEGLAGVALLDGDAGRAALLLGAAVA